MIGTTNLAVRRAVAGDVAGKGVDVVDPLDLPALRRGAAHALAERHADAGRAALERPEHQLAVDIAIEADPIDVGQCLPDQRRGIGHVGDSVGLAGDQPFERLGEIAYIVALSAASILKSYISRSLTLPRAAFTALRRFFSSTRLALAALLGRVGLRLRRTIWACGDHFRQPGPRILAVGLLGPKAARGDQQLAASSSSGFRRSSSAAE